MKWTVARLWHGIEAETAVEAISRADRGLHDEVRASQHGQLAQVYLSAEELAGLVDLINESIPSWPAQMAPGPGPLPEALSRRFRLFNGLRTALTEAGRTLAQEASEE